MNFTGFNPVLLHHMFVFSIVASVVYCVCHVFQYLVGYDYDIGGKNKSYIVRHLIFFVLFAYLLTEFVISLPDK